MKRNETTPPLNKGRESLFQSLPDALRALRGNRSQAEMAELCGKTQTWWSYLEGGWRNPRVPDLVVLSKHGLSLVNGKWSVNEQVVCVDCGHVLDYLDMSRDPERRPCPRYRSGMHRWDGRERRFFGDYIEDESDV